jgi:DNA replication protein DnaC
MIDFVLPEPVPDDVAAAADAEREAAVNARILADITDKNEEGLHAPDWWTIDNYKLSGKFWVAGVQVEPMLAVEALLDGAPGVIAGGTNTGKSHLAVAIARGKAGRTAARIKDFALAIQAEVNRYRPSEGYTDMIELAKRVECLVFDDIGKNLCHANGATTYYGNVVFDIMDARAEKRLQTIVTTRFVNQDLLTDRLGEDLYRRIKGTEGGVARHVAVLLGEAGK